MHRVEVLEDFLSDLIRVSVDSKILTDADGKERTFKDTFAAALAGAKEVDRLRDRGKTFVTGADPTDCKR